MEHDEFVRIIAKLEAHNETDREWQTRIAATLDQVSQRVACIPLLKARVDQMEPTVKALEKRNDEAIGAAKLARWAGRSAWAIGGAGVMAWLHTVIGSKP